MENIRNLKDWFIDLGLSDQAIVVIGVVVFGLLIFGIFSKITKNKPKVAITPTSNGKTVVGMIWKVIGLGLAFGAGYGIYLIVVNNLPTPEEKTLSELSKNLAEMELQPEKDKLVALNAKVKDGGSLTDEEKMVAMNATKKIGKIRKDYSKGKLVAPAPPPPTPTTKMAWVLRINGNFNRQSSEAVEIDGKEKFLITDKEIMFSYKDGKGGQAVWLTREKTGNFYHGVFALRDKTKQELFLLENGEMFSGYIQQVNGNGKSKKALLRKEEVMIK